jgi:hypothetical protein
MNVYGIRYQGNFLATSLRSVIPGLPRNRALFSADLGGSGEPAPCGSIALKAYVVNLLRAFDPFFQDTSAHGI